jgi:hypothetical protein
MHEKNLKQNSRDTVALSMLPISSQCGFVSLSLVGRCKLEDFYGLITCVGAEVLRGFDRQRRLREMVKYNRNLGPATPSSSNPSAVGRKRSHR